VCSTHTHTQIGVLGLGVFVSLLLFSGIAKASSYSVLVGGSIKSTNSFITYGAGANLHTNGNLKNNGLFKVSGDVEIVGSLFTAHGTHPVEATGNIILPAQYITIPVLSPQCWPKVNYRFEGGASNNSGYIQIYDDNGNLLQTITGGRWWDPSGNQWEYNAKENRWHLEGNNPEVLSGIVYFDTGFKTDVPLLKIGDQMNGGLLIVNGQFQSESALHIRALFSYEHALIVFGDAEFHGGEDEESEAEGHKGWIDDSEQRDKGYNNLITGRVYITRDLESTAPTKINGKLTILGNLDTEGAMRVEYMEGAIKAESYIVAQDFSTPVTLVASQNFSDPTGLGSANLSIFAKGSLSITPATNLLDFLKTALTLSSDTITVIGGNDTSMAPILVEYTTWPSSPIIGLAEILHSLVLQGYTTTTLRITNFIFTLPFDLWVTISDENTTIGTFYVNGGTSDPHTLDEAGIQAYTQYMNNMIASNPTEEIQAQIARNNYWAYYISKTTEISTTNSSYSSLFYSKRNIGLTDFNNNSMVCSEDILQPDQDCCTYSQDGPYYVPNYAFVNTAGQFCIAGICFPIPVPSYGYQYVQPSGYIPTAISPACSILPSNPFNSVAPLPVHNYCSPTAAAMVLGYWANCSNGYMKYLYDVGDLIGSPSNYSSDLTKGCMAVTNGMAAINIGCRSDPCNNEPYPVNSTDPTYKFNPTNLILELGSAMGTSINNGTDVNQIGSGISKVANRSGYCFKTTTRNWGTLCPSQCVWNHIVDEINQQRPTVLSGTNMPTYGAHSVAIFGYMVKRYGNGCIGGWCSICTIFGCIKGCCIASCPCLTPDNPYAIGNDGWSSGNVYFDMAWWATIAHENNYWSLTTVDPSLNSPNCKPNVILTGTCPQQSSSIGCGGGINWHPYGCSNTNNVNSNPGDMILLLMPFSVLLIFKILKDKLFIR